MATVKCPDFLPCGVYDQARNSCRPRRPGGATWHLLFFGGNADINQFTCLKENSPGILYVRLDSV